MPSPELPECAYCRGWAVVETPLCAHPKQPFGPTPAIERCGECRLISPTLNAGLPIELNLEPWEDSAQGLRRCGCCDPPV